MRILSNSTACLLGLLFCHSLNAQFKNKAALEPVTKTGFYSITVTPELSSYLKTDFSDLRVMDTKNNQAAYIIKAMAPSLDSTLFQPLRILSYTLSDSGKSTLILENTGRKKITNLSLIIKNTAVSRRAAISGGEDLRNWYTIAENTDLQKSYVNDTDRYVENIILPYSVYKYYKVVVYNGKNDPLNIVSAGVYTPSILAHLNTTSIFTINPATTFKQKDSSDGYSYLYISSNLPFHINRIHLKVKGPKYFKRDVDVMGTHQLLYNFTISSDTLFHFSVPAFKNKEWLIKIFNGDNPPLRVEKIATEQDGEKIICWLDSGKSYHLEMNNSNARVPQYDLQNFKDSIPTDIKSIQFSGIEPLVLTNTTANKIIFNQTWLWIVIITLLIGLLYFTWSLTREIKNKNEDKYK